VLVSRHLWRRVGDARWRQLVSLPPDVAAEIHCRSTAWTRRSALRPRIQTLARKEEDAHIGAQAEVVRSSYHVWSDFVARNKTQQNDNKDDEYEQVKNESLALEINYPKQTKKRIYPYILYQALLCQ